ncbi:hypothetical protein GW750_03075 [bacterium]|nr:hypothetical protein [bacterium]
MYAIHIPISNKYGSLNLENATKDPHKTHTRIARIINFFSFKNHMYSTFVSCVAITFSCLGVCIRTATHKPILSITTHMMKGNRRDVYSAITGNNANVKTCINETFHQIFQ